MSSKGLADCLEIHSTHEAMSRRAADVILAELRANPRLLLGAATGSTPTQAYDRFVQSAPLEPGLACELRLIKLDEWGGLAMDHGATCEVYLRRHLIEPLGITRDRYLGWNSRPADPPAECDRVATWLREHGPIDLCVLGLGANGHLAFNEPGESLTPGSHVATLTETSLRHPMLNGTTARPQYGLTLGMADILHSRRILLLVSGAKKAEQLQRTLEGPITTRFPASFLRLHADVTILCDRDAAGGIAQS
jgi:galactosamine-6-phosphate isomerase